MSQIQLYDKLEIKVIQGIFKQNIKPKCQIKWEEQYGGNIGTFKK
jgi:hypothetical protein